MGATEKGQPLFQSVTESMVAAQERNVQFVQGVLENGTEVLRSHVEGTRTLMQTLTEQSHKQREAFGVLARGTWDAYRGFFPSPFRFYESAMESPSPSQCMESETPEKAPHHEKQAIRAATK